MPRGIPNKARAKKATAKKATAKKATTKKAATKKAAAETAPMEDAAIQNNAVETARSLVTAGNLTEIELGTMLPKHEVEGLTAKEPIYYLIPLVIRRDSITPLYQIYWKEHYPNRPLDRMPSIDSPAGRKFLREFFTTDIRSMLLEHIHRYKAEATKHIPL